MAVVLPFTLAVGVLKDPEGSAKKWKQAKTFSHNYVPHQFHIRCSLREKGPHQDYHGRRLINMPVFIYKFYGYYVSADLSETIISGGMKSSHAPFLHPPVFLPRSFLYEREVPVLISEGGEGTDPEDADESDGENESGNVIQETLKMFEWPAICAQVAQYACTPMGISIAKEANLTIGADKVQSEELLLQTAHALAFSDPLDFSGIEDLQGLLGEAMAGSACEISELCSIKNTLIGVQSVYDQLCDPIRTNSDSFSSKPVKDSVLRALMMDCDLCSDLVSEISYSLDSVRGTILDRATPALATARESREENMRALEMLLKEAAAWVVQQGGMDSIFVTRRRSRLCIAVRTSHKTLLPGGLILDVSNTGTTSFMEPEPALRLNNEETRLAAAEKAEEIAVLKALTIKVVHKTDSIMNLLGRITVLDLACARASHARWLGSVSPSFIDKRMPQFTSQSGGHNSFIFDIDGVRHPLLLGAVVSSLPASQRLGVVKSSSSVQSGGAKPNEANGTNVSETLKLPVPIDIKIREQVRVVTLTGPNTGGKTATLKACGVAAIMAKAGLFVPAKGQPRLPWFDVVLADVGDSQSLEQSLSTFSGHIRRISSILDQSTDQSFVLLDEIGGGTDPSEGAALATAILKHLSAEVGLTIATTHSAELKSLNDLDPTFENASVEFDIVTLKPTYRVLWGLAGQSNALDIATSLGFDQKILARARELVGKLRPSLLGARTAEVLVPLINQRDEMLELSAKAAQVLSKAQELHQELKAATENLRKREAAYRKLTRLAAQSDIERARSRIDQLIGSCEEEMAPEAFKDTPIREIRAKISAIVDEFKQLPENTATLELFARDEGSMDETSGAIQFAVGEKVLVRKLGKAPVTITGSPEKDSEFLTVQLGTLKMQVNVNEVVKMKMSGSDPKPAKPEKVQITNKIRKPTKTQTKEETSSEPKYQVAVQTSRNTLDLRGMRVEDAVRELNMTLASKSPQSVVFVVHGIGTGAVKEAVHQTLRQHPYVAKFEEESITNAGCTIVYIK